ARQDIVVGVSIALTLISVIIVSLRIYTRAFIVRNVGKDDVCMIAALLFTLAFLAILFVLRANRMGFSDKSMTLSQMITTVKANIAISIVYYLCVNAVKISILIFYLRIANGKTFERICKATIYLLAIFCAVCIIVVFTQCMPLSMRWDFIHSVQGHCIDGPVFMYMFSAINIIADIWILVLPIKVLLGIQRPGREKIALIAVFALGVFSCIASIIRLNSVRLWVQSKQPFLDSVPISLFSMVEINIGIWCACIPALKALFSKTLRQRSKHASGYQYHGSERSG
ncbi:hypothetical protein FB567DRAFT_425201, partial [Paraphoma chrysanthemicola]